MLLADVNVLVYAHRADATGHRDFKAWLMEAISGPEPFGVSDHVLSGFLRVVTHPRVFDPPSPLSKALAFASEIRGAPNAVHVAPGPRHWDIFAKLCRGARARGNLVPDAHFAALAIESGCEWVTTDKDYARFDGLRWRHPLD
ncbi:MAG: TA system VapC family ribonuclease toxin [Planctomycetota bacterium]